MKTGKQSKNMAKATKENAPLRVTVEKPRTGKRKPMARLVIPLVTTDKLGEVLSELAKKAEQQLPVKPTMARGSISLF